MFDMDQQQHLDAQPLLQLLQCSTSQAQGSSSQQQLQQDEYFHLNNNKITLNL